MVGTWLRQHMIVSVWFFRLVEDVGAGAPMPAPPVVEPLDGRRAQLTVVSDVVEDSDDAEWEDGKEIEEEVRGVRGWFCRQRLGMGVLVTVS